MIVMPVSGFLWTTGHGHAVAPFGLIHFPRIAFGYRALGDAAERVHLVGQWLLYGLITLHLAGVSYHLVDASDSDDRALGRAIASCHSSTENLTILMSDASCAWRVVCVAVPGTACCCKPL
jgi:cytochrome b561